jgi:DNA-binding transcriptional ArsR family regulator
MPGVSQKPSTKPVPVRFVEDVETLRVLADPLRLAIVNLLMEGASREPKVRTAKQLARELGQPQTKLYRHIKQLHAAGLIQVADTRMVSGIVESRYRTGQLSLRIDENLLGGRIPVDDTLRTLAVLLDRHRDDLFAAIRAGRVHLDAGGVADPIKPAVAILNATIPAEIAAAFASRVAALIEDFTGIDSDPGGVPINMVVMYYATGGPP